MLLDIVKDKLSIKIIDFGLSTSYTNETLLSTSCGTGSYAPPEMHKGEEYYGLLSDVWSAGVVLYAMVYGYLPFCEDDEDVNAKNIINGNYNLPNVISEDARDIIKHCMDIDPLERYDIEQIKEHSHFSFIFSKSLLSMNIFTIAAMKTVYITLEQETIFYIQTYVTGGKNYTNEQLTKI